MSVTEELLRPLLAGNSARPLITHYDDAAGTRVELSVATLANWAAKTANWITEEIDEEPGNVAVMLPAHWQTAGILLGAWWCGARIVDNPEVAQIAFTPVGVPAPGAIVHAVVSLDPMGMGLRGGPPDGTVDYITESRAHGDEYYPLFASSRTTALLSMSGDQVIAAARAKAISGRVLSTKDWTLPDGVIEGFLAVLAGGGSLVQVSNPAKVDAHLTAEKATLLP